MSLTGSAGLGAEWLPDFVRATFAANFARDRDISQAEVLGGILDAAGQDGAGLVAQAATPALKQRLRAQTDRARALGIFGAPSFAVGDELFWGNDRLGDAIAWARLHAT